MTPVEIACDESGSEGENLIGGNTDVFAHASVLMPVEAAQNCILELRSRIRSPAEQYKANHLLRGKHRPTLIWLLGPSGPLHGHAHVHLVDKTYFAIARVVDLLIGEESPAIFEAYSDVVPAPRIRLSVPPREQGAGLARISLVLHREGPHTFGPARWQAFLESCNDLMRIKNRQGMRTSIDSFFHQLETLHPAGPHIAEILTRLAKARPRAESFRAQLAESYPLFPALDPFLPAIVQTIHHWTRGGQNITIVHDRQTALSEPRIAHLKETNPHLTSLTLIESALDPRIQVADFLAGTARKIASEELNNRGDAELTALLHPYVDPRSIWADSRSWSLLAPTDPGR